MPASIYTYTLPPSSLANGTFSSWSEPQCCLKCNEIYKDEPLGMPAMRQRVPVLSEKPHAHFYRLHNGWYENGFTRT